MLFIAFQVKVAKEQWLKVVDELLLQACWDLYFTVLFH